MRKDLSLLPCPNPDCGNQYLFISYEEEVFCDVCHLNARLNCWNAIPRALT